MWFLFAAIASITWGIDYTLGEQLFRNKISPIALLAVEMFFGAIIFSCLAYATDTFKSNLQILISNRSLLWVFLAILITFNAANLLIFYSIKASNNAALAGLVELSYPIFTVLFAWLLFSQNHLSWALIIGGSLILIGVSIIYYFNPT